jgi:hypothetical protein
VVCWRGNEAAHDGDRVGRSLSAKTSSREQGPIFNLVGTSRTVVIRETREAKHTTCWSGSSPVGCTPIRIVMTLSDMSDRLSLQLSSSMFCCIDSMD